jgi:hypothetical protein
MIAGPGQPGAPSPPETEAPGTVDYLLRSVDALFVPVTSAAILGLLALWGNALLVPRLRARRARRANARIVYGIAVGGATLGIVSIALTFATAGEKGSFVAVLAESDTFRLRFYSMGIPAPAGC